MAKQIAVKDMDIVFGVSDNVFYETREDYDRVIEGWMEDMLNKYSSSIILEE